LLTLAQPGKEKRKIMPPFLYRCPNTGDNVQAWMADDPEDDDLTYIQVTCLACAQSLRGVLHVHSTRQG
jgi:predicted nucleic acid-binding Zn ribbon protein